MTNYKLEKNTQYNFEYNFDVLIAKYKFQTPNSSVK